MSNAQSRNAWSANALTASSPMTLLTCHTAGQYFLHSFGIVEFRFFGGEGIEGARFGVAEGTLLRSLRMANDAGIFEPELASYAMAGEKWQVSVKGKQFSRTWAKMCQGSEPAPFSIS